MDARIDHDAKALRNRGDSFSFPHVGHLVIRLYALLHERYGATQDQESSEARRSPPMNEPSKVLLRFADLKRRHIVNTRQTLENWIKEGRFPKGIMLGRNTKAWHEHEVEDYVRLCAAGERPPARGAALARKLASDSRKTAKIAKPESDTVPSDRDV
jgi:predicted DNA-binding transcriptional regulator AlpA